MWKAGSITKIEKLVEHLDHLNDPTITAPAAAQDRAASNLNTLIPHIDIPQTDFTICFKVFNDLDTLLFAGVLHDAVEDPTGDGMIGINAAFARRVSIVFCKGWARAEAPKAMDHILAVLIRSMLKVFALVVMDWKAGELEFS